MVVVGERFASDLYQQSPGMKVQKKTKNNKLMQDLLLLDWQTVMDWIVGKDLRLQWCQVHKIPNHIMKHKGEEIAFAKKRVKFTATAV